MASNGKATRSPVKGLPESPQTEMAPPPLDLFRTDFSLRLMVLSASVASLGIVLTSHQTKVVGFPLLPSPITLEAKFTYSSAVIYLVVATSVVCLYSLLSTVSVFIVPKTSPSSPRLLLLLAFLDALMAAMMASATGAVAAVSYIGLKGNSHIGWNKVCNVFDKFCAHAAGSVVLALVVSLVLLVLVLTSTYSLYRRAASGVRPGCFAQVEAHLASDT